MPGSPRRSAAGRRFARPVAPVGCGGPPQRPAEPTPERWLTMAVAAALSRIGRRFQGWPARVAPTAVLIGSALAVALSGPHAHYGMLLAVAPCLAAAVHGVHATAGIGVLAVALFGVLRHDLAFADFDLWLGRLSFV